jgi:N-acetylneuraminate synthase
MDEITIGSHRIGHGQPALIIGEVAQAHDGSLNLAHAFIDAIADAGADAVKFQTHIAEAEGTSREEFRKSSPWNSETKSDFWKRTGFNEEQWSGLHRHARERHVVFLSSPFSVEAVDLLERIGVTAWKVASGEITNFQMMEQMGETKKPILLSSGLSSWQELDRAVNFIRSHGFRFALFQCTTAYPCPPEEVGLNVLDELRTRYQVPVGLSDHFGKIYSGLAAISLGANMLEVHVTLSREMYGTSVSASLTPPELRQLVEGTRFIEAMLHSPVDKNVMASTKASLRPIFLKSVVAKNHLAEGTVLEKKDLTAKKPGTGIPADRLEDLIGRRLARNVKKDEMFIEGDFVS